MLRAALLKLDWGSSEASSLLDVERFLDRLCRSTFPLAIRAEEVPRDVHISCPTTLVLPNCVERGGRIGGLRTGVVGLE
jgi:hypothetical protein